MDLPTVRRSGYAFLLGPDGYTKQVPSCAICAHVLDVPWMSALFEGACQGCEVALSGNPV